jgi:ABC-2 type transport system permease protein
MGAIGGCRATLQFYWTLYTMAVKARVEYRVDFVVAIATALMTQLSGLSFYWVVFERVPSLGGWPPAAVMFLFAMTAMVLGLSELFLNGIWSLPAYIVSGDLDRLLLYPVSPLNFVLLARPELHSLGNLGSGALLIGLYCMDIPLPVWGWLLVPLWVLSGALIYNAALVLTGSLLFVMVGPWTQQFTFVHQLLHAARYPANIYPRLVQLLLLVVFPVALATFVPGQWLLSRCALWLAALLPPVVAAVATWVAHRTWEVGLRSYQSTGS